MNLKKVPWTNIALAAFAVAALRILRFSLYDRGNPGVAVALFILGVAVWRLPRSLYGKDERPPTIDGIAGMFLSALRRLRREAWLQWLFGAVAALNVISAATSFYAVRVIYRGYGNPPGQPFQANASSIIFPPERLSSLVTKVVPSVGASVDTVACGIWALAFVVWASLAFVRLGRIAPSERDGRARATRVLAIPLAGLFAFIGVWSPIMASRMANSAPSGHLQATDVLWLAAIQVLSYIVEAVLLAGLIGSFIRSRRGEDISLGTFVDDSARSWLPISGFFLVLSLIASVPAIISLCRTGGLDLAMMMPGAGSERFIGPIYTILRIVTAFVPIAIAVEGRGVWAGIGRGLERWFVNLRSTLTLLAMGTTALAVLSIAKGSLYYLLYIWSPETMNRLSPGHATGMVIGAAFYALSSAAITLALLELYWTIRFHHEERPPSAEAGAVEIQA